MDVEEALGQGPERCFVEVAVQRDARPLSRLTESGLEGHRVHSLHHLGKHLHEPAARVPGDVRVAGAPSHALNRRLGQPEVENGVQHAGHRHRCPGANRKQQRVIGVAELLPAGVLELAHGVGDLVIETSGELTAVAYVLNACGGGDGEAAGHLFGAQNPGHLGEVGALVAEQLTHVGGAILEWVHPSGGCGGGAQRVRHHSIAGVRVLASARPTKSASQREHEIVYPITGAITRCAKSTRRLE